MRLTAVLLCVALVVPVACGPSGDGGGDAVAGAGAAAGTLPAIPGPLVDAELPPAADPGAETARVAVKANGVARAPSRSRKHYVVADRVEQRVGEDGSVTLEVDAHLDSTLDDVLLDEERPVRRFVTTNGHELTFPEQGHEVRSDGRIRAWGMDLGEKHRGLRDLEIDARIIEVRKREELRSDAVGAAGNVGMGPYVVRVAIGGGTVGVRARLAEGALARWDESHPQPFPRGLDAEWFAAHVEAFDASGAALTKRTDDSADAVEALAHFVDAGGGAPRLPVTLVVSVPAEYRLEATTFYFKQLMFE